MTSANGTRAIDTIQVGERYRQDLGDLTSLMRSVEDVGLLHPIVIKPDGTLIAGQRRLEACKLLGWDAVPVRVLDLEDLIRAEHDENAVRKDFLPSEAVAIARALKPIEREAARKRQGTRTDLELCAKFAQSSNDGKTRNRIAQRVGMSGWTLQKAQQVVEAAEAEPEKYEPLVEEMDRTGRVNGVYRKLKVMRQAEEIANEPPPLPSGPFRVIVADPPWSYDKRAQDPSHRVRLPYPDMTLEEIKALPVGNLAEEDAILWLWTTNAHLPVAFEVLDTWGFEYKTMVTWVKDRMGMGDWLRGKTEHCLLAVRGRPVVTLSNQTTVIYGPVRGHSRKPDEFYEMVEGLCPGSKLELFSRTERGGWIGYGDELGQF